MVRVWDLSGQYPLGVQSVQVQVLERAEQLAQARGAVQVAGQVRLALRDLDLAQVQGTEWEWVQEQERVQVVELERELEQEQVVEQEQVEEQERELEQVRERVVVAELELESALPRGDRLDSEQGLVRDWEREQVAELG